MTNQTSFTETTQLIINPPTSKESLAATIAQISGLANKLGLQQREIVKFSMSETMTIPKHSLVEFTWHPLKASELVKKAESKEAEAQKLLRFVLNSNDVASLDLTKKEIQEYLKRS